LGFGLGLVTADLRYLRFTIRFNVMDKLSSNEKYCSHAMLIKPPFFVTVKQIYECVGHVAYALKVYYDWQMAVYWLLVQLKYWSFCYYYYRFLSKKMNK